MKQKSLCVNLVGFFVPPPKKKQLLHTTVAFRLELNLSLFFWQFRLGSNDNLVKNGLICRNQGLKHNMHLWFLRENIKSAQKQYTGMVLNCFLAKASQVVL